MPVKRYDPNRDVQAADWLALPEEDRLEMIVAWHRRHRVQLPKVRLHAVFHFVVENQIALGIKEVNDAMRRLQDEGLSRHDAIHAISSVLSDHLIGVLNSDALPGPEAHAPYFERLTRLTAQEWLDSAR